MASAIETSIGVYKSAYINNFGASAIPTWLQDLLSMIPALLAGCGLSTPAEVNAVIADDPLRADLLLRSATRQAGVPILQRSRAVKASLDAWAATPDSDKANLIAFSQSM